MKKNKYIFLIIVIAFLLSLTWNYCTETDPYDFPMGWQEMESSSSTSTVSTDSSGLSSNTSSSITTSSSSSAKVVNPGDNPGSTEEKDRIKPLITKIDIDNNAEVTADLVVFLVVMATDNVAVTEMQVSNDGGVTWSGYFPYTPVITDYQLPYGENGTRSVYIMVRDAEGNESVAAVDSINYIKDIDTQDPEVTYMIVNNGDLATSKQDVTVFLTAKDDISVTSMCYSTDGITYSSWVPFDQILNATLASGVDGNRTIYVKVKDGMGNESQPATDDIAYISSVYVDSYAELGNPCSKEFPCKTITEGVISARKLNLTKVNVKKGTYQDSFFINHDIELLGGWNSDYTVRDKDLYPTIIEGKNGSLTTISIYEVSNSAVIDGFTIYGPEEVSTSVTPSHAIYCSLSANPTIKNNIIVGSKSSIDTNDYCYGIYVTGASKPVITNNTIIGYTGTSANGGDHSAAILVRGMLSNPVITQNTIKGADIANTTWRYGIVVEENAFPTIENNTKIYGQKSYYSYGIYIKTAQAMIKNNASIMATDFYDSTATNLCGIYMEDDSYAVIDGNTIYGYGGNSSGDGVGIYMRDNSFADIKNNSLIRGGYTGTGTGIYFYDCIGYKTLNITSNTKIQGTVNGNGNAFYSNTIDRNILNFNGNTEIVGTESSGTGYGIRINAGQYATISVNNNTGIYGSLNGNAAYALYIPNTAGTTNINGNTTIAGSKNGYSSGTYYGIYTGLHSTLNIKDTVTGIYGSKGSCGDGYAIYMSDDINHLNIENNASIIGVASGYASGTVSAIYGDRVMVKANIKNNTLIQGAQTIASNAYGIYFSAACPANPFNITDNATIQGSTNNVLSNAYGIYFQGNFNGYIKNSTLIQGSSSNVSSNAYGIRLGSGNNVDIANITSYVRGTGASATNSYGIYLGNFNYVDINSIPSIYGSLGSTSSTSMGIRTGSFFNLVIDNISTMIQGSEEGSNDTYGIYIASNGTKFSIEDIPIIRGSNGNTSNIAAGLYINGNINDFYVDNITNLEGISDNHYGKTVYGIRMLSTPFKGTIKNSSIKGGGMVSSNGTAYGIYMSGDQMNTLVTGNSIVAADIISPGAKTYGMYLYDVYDGLYIDSNTLIRGGLTGGGSNGSTTSFSDNIGIYMERYASPQITDNANIEGSHNSPGCGIGMYSLYAIAGSYIKIDSNFIKGSGASKNNSFGIQHIYNYQDLGSNHPVVTNNIIKGNNGTGNSSAAYLIYGVTANRTYYDVIANNILYGGAASSTTATSSSGIALYRATGTIAPIILNNIIYNTPGGGGNFSYAIAELSASINPSRIENNMAFNCDYYYYDSGTTTRDFTNLNNSANTCACTPANNIDDNTQGTAGLFTDESSNNYVPKASAYNIDKGFDTSDIADGKVRIDYLGVQRPQSTSYDIGPYEKN